MGMSGAVELRLIKYGIPVRRFSCEDGYMSDGPITECLKMCLFFFLLVILLLYVEVYNF